MESPSLTSRLATVAVLTAGLVALAGASASTGLATPRQPQGLEASDRSGTDTLYGDPGFSPDTGLQTIADHWVTVFEAKLGHTLGLQVVAGASTSPPATPGALAETTPANAHAANSSGPFCRIQVFAPGMQTSTTFRRLFLAHEVFHCFQFDLAPQQDHAWIIEGLADWAALTVDPVPYSIGGANLTTYIDQPGTPLFARSYDAVGFWGHVQDTTHDLWARIPAILNASSNQASYKAAGGDSSAFLSTWGSSVFHDSSSPDWSMTSPIEPPAPPDGHIEAVPGAGNVSAAPYTTSQYKLIPVAGKPLIHIEIHGYARLSETDNIVNPSALEDKWLCTLSSGCACPPGSTGETPKSSPLPPDLLLGVTGAPEAKTTGTIESFPLSSFCNGVATETTTTTETPAPTQGGVKNCGTVTGAVNHDLPDDVPNRNLYTVEVFGDLSCAFAKTWTAKLTSAPPTAGNAVHSYPLIGPAGYICSGNGGPDSSTFSGDCANPGAGEWLWGDNPH